MDKRLCEKCTGEFYTFNGDVHAHIAKIIYCPECRCQPGKHRFTLIKRVIICTDCGKRRMPLSLVVRRAKAYPIWTRKIQLGLTEPNTVDM